MGIGRVERGERGGWGVEGKIPVDSYLHIIVFPSCSCIFRFFPSNTPPSFS